VRFFKRGPIEVVRHLLDVRDRLPTDAGDSVGISAELRAIRPWEEFDEGILRFSFRITQAAVAGQNGGIQLWLNGWHTTAGSYGVVPRGTLWILDELENGSVGVRFLVNRTAAATGLINGGDLCEYGDTRWGGINPVSPLNVNTGSNAAVFGDSINEVSAGQRLSKEGIFISEATPGDQLGNDHALTIWGDTVNVALVAILSGRVIFPR
jgi:hypothetical protein